MYHFPFTKPNTLNQWSVTLSFSPYKVTSASLWQDLISLLPPGHVPRCFPLTAYKIWIHYIFYTFRNSVGLFFPIFFRRKKIPTLCLWCHSFKNPFELDSKFVITWLKVTHFVLLKEVLCHFQSHGKDGEGRRQHHALEYCFALCNRTSISKFNSQTTDTRRLTPYSNFCKCFYRTKIFKMQ